MSPHNAHGNTLLHFNNKHSGTDQFDSLLAAQRGGVVALVPLTEGSSINLYDGTLHQGLGTYQLVVAGIVYDINDTSLPGLGYKSEIKLLFSVL